MRVVRQNKECIAHDGAMSHINGVRKELRMHTRASRAPRLRLGGGPPRNGKRHVRRKDTRHDRVRNPEPAGGRPVNLRMPSSTCCAEQVPDHVPGQGREAARHCHLVRYPRSCCAAMASRSWSTSTRSTIMPAQPVDTEQFTSQVRGQAAAAGHFLSRVRQAEAQVTMFLVNGVMLQGRIASTICSACCSSVTVTSSLPTNMPYRRSSPQHRST